MRLTLCHAYTAMMAAAMFFLSPFLGAAPFEHKIAVEATAPSDQFYIEADGNWLIKPLSLNWNPALMRLNSTPMHFLNLLSKLGSITVKANAETVLKSAEGNTIPLTARLSSGQAICILYLRGDGSQSPPCQLLDELKAQSGNNRIGVVISADKDHGYIPGIYQGAVSLLFESGAP
ncbi:MAG: hypothetical protein ACRC0J_06285 [Shewanella oncorhynchi]